MAVAALAAARRGFQSKWGKVGITLLILNEIRGLAVVSAVVLAWLHQR